MRSAQSTFIPVAENDPDKMHTGFPISDGETDEDIYQSVESENEETNNLLS